MPRDGIENRQATGDKGLMEFLEPLTEQLLSMWEGFVRALPLLVMAGLVLIITWLASRILAGLVHRALSRSSLRPALKELFVTLT